MKQNLKNCVHNSLTRIIEMEGIVDKSGEPICGMSPAYSVQLMNDCLKIILEAKPEDLPKMQKEMREFLCADTEPLQAYGTVRMG